MCKHYWYKRFANQFVAGVKKWSPAGCVTDLVKSISASIQSGSISRRKWWKMSCCLCVSKPTLCASVSGAPGIIIQAWAPNWDLIKEANSSSFKSSNFWPVGPKSACKIVQFSAGSCKKRPPLTYDNLNPQFASKLVTNFVSWWFRIPCLANALHKRCIYLIPASHLQIMHDLRVCDLQTQKTDPKSICQFVCPHNFGEHCYLQPFFKAMRLM